jgi:hypothetical protein
MGKFLKYGCLPIVLVFVAIIAIAAFNMGGDNTDPNKTAPTDEEVTGASDRKEVEPAESSKITEENFDKIVEGDWDGTGGMTVEEVEAILGKPSQTMKSKTDGMEMLDYAWMDGIMGDTIQVSFSDGKVSFKMWMPAGEE